MTISAQPVCDQCWDAYSYGAHGEIRLASRVLDAAEESCCLCGTQTRSGIYIRADENTVPHPSNMPSLEDFSQPTP